MNVDLYFKALRAAWHFSLDELNELNKKYNLAHLKVALMKKTQNLSHKSLTTKGLKAEYSNKFYVCYKDKIFEKKTHKFVDMKRS